jgi:Icc-related predicted phosphoesterase
VARTRLFFATDIHGSVTCFLKFLNASRVYKADVMVLAGDLSGKLLIPIVERGDDSYESTFMGVRHVVSEGKRTELEERIRRVGSYPHIMSKNEYDELLRKPERANALFEGLIRERIEKWVTLADDRLRGASAEYYVSGGNDDFPWVDELLKKSQSFTDGEGDVIRIRGRNEMMTCGWSNPTPWGTPRETSEDDLTKKITGLASEVESMDGCIFNLHAPPYDSDLDVCQRLSEELKPIFVGGQPDVFNAGSVAVRRCIEEFKPMLGLHGHIHESRGVAMIGRTTCVNPGSEYAETILRGTILDIENNHVKNHILTSG